MVQEKFSALLPTIEKTASAEFGIPSLKARSKMKKRLLKKKRLFPYAGLCGDVRMRLRRESTTADYPRAKLDPDLSEHDAVMLDLLIDTAEAHGCSVVLFVPFENPLEPTFVMDAPGTTAEQLESFASFTDALLRLPFIEGLEAKISDGWHLNAEEGELTFGELSFKALQA